MVLAYATSITPSCDEILGTFGMASNGYMLFAPGAASGVPNSLGTIASSGSPLVVGVSSFSANQGLLASITLVNGGTAIASWSSGDPLIVAGTIRGATAWTSTCTPRPTPWSSAGGSATVRSLLRNALLYE